MSNSEYHRPISRRTALAAGAAAVVGTVGLVGPVTSAGAVEPTGRRPHCPLSLLQQAGQRVIFSYPGLVPPDSLLQQIRAGEVGGVIFFGENITSVAQISTVVQQLRQARAHSGFSSPLLLMTDQEGGIVRRLKGQAPLLSEKADRRVRGPADGGHCSRHRRRADPGPGRYESEPVASAGRVPRGG